MASIVILLIMAGCAAAQFLKGSLVKSFVTFISALIASFVGLWWYEQAAAFAIKQEYIVDYAQPACFGMIFLISFAILQTAGLALTKQKIDFGEKPERIGRAAFGLLLGYVISGVLLIGASMAPLPSEYPYPRFEGNRAPKSPKRALLNPDGFISGFFGIISGGSVSGAQSFAVLHAGFVDELSLNRLLISQKVKVLSEAGAMAAKSIWLAPDGLMDTEGKSMSSKYNKNDGDLIVARVEFAGTMLSDGILTPSQLRFQCKKKGEEPRLGGSAVSVYPIGYLQSATQVKTVGINEKITLDSQNAQDGVVSKNFVCYVPKDYEPVAVGLKSGAIAAAPSMVTAEQATKESSSVSGGESGNTQQPAAPQDANVTQ